MKIRKLLLLLLPLSMCFLWTAQASAYSATTSLTYNVGTDLLTGYSETTLGYYDIYENEYCSATSFYEWSDGYYVEECVQQMIQDFAYAGVEPTEYAPYGAIFFDYQAAPYSVVSLFPPVSHPDAGMWNALANHYSYEDDYECDLVEYGWPGNPPLWSCFYTGSFEYYLTTSSASQSVSCNATVTSMIAEYTTFNVTFNGVPFRPVCSDFSSSGNTTYYTWAQLNGGFSTGNPHNPWGMIKPQLKTLVDATTTLWGSTLLIDGGYRTPQGNFNLRGSGSAVHSRHMQGIAVDIKTSSGWNDITWISLAIAAVDAGASYIEPITMSDTHVHEDVR